MKLLFVLIAVLPLSLFAETFIEDAEITSITTRGNGFQSIVISKPIPDIEVDDKGNKCSHPDRIIINENEIGSKSMISLAIYAMSSKSKISIRLDGCESIDPRFATFTSPKLSRMRVH